MSTSGAPDKITATSRLLETIREMRRRIAEETDSTRIGNIGSLATLAAYYCNNLGRPNPPLELLRYSRDGDAPKCGLVVNGATLPPPPTPWAFPNAASNPEIHYAFGYRLHDPWEGNCAGTVDVLTSAVADCNDPARPMTIDPLETTDKLETRAYIAATLAQWERFTENTLRPEAIAAGAEAERIVVGPAKPATAGADVAVDTGGAPFDLDIDTLSDADKRAISALQEYKRVEKKLIECGVGSPTDRQCYDKLTEEDAASGENQDRPNFATWVRILRRGRKLTGQQKHRPRTGRQHCARSVVGQNEI